MIFTGAQNSKMKKKSCEQGQKQIFVAKLFNLYTNSYYFDECIFLTS